MLKRPPSQSIEDSSSDSESDPEEIFKARQDSVINDCFLGFFSSTVSCRNCGKSRTTTDAFSIVSLPIPSTAAKEVCTLDRCLRFFSTLETLSAANMIDCNQCKTRVRGTKKLQLATLPRCLVLHLKRFSQEGVRNVKCLAPIIFPLEGLDMAPYTSHGASAVYDCVAVCCHHGNNSTSGHYTAFARRGGSWFHYNDASRPSQVDGGKVTSNEGLKDAYMIFYVKRD